MEIVRVVIEIAAQHKWKIFQMDVKSTFLNGLSKEEFYIDHPLGYEVLGEEDKVYRLKRDLYGLRQLPRAWYSQIDSYFVRNSFRKSDGEPTLYIKTIDGKILFFFLYVDLIFTGDDDCLIADFKQAMKDDFKMIGLGILRYFLKIEVQKIDDGICIPQ